MSIKNRLVVSTSPRCASLEFGEPDGSKLTIWVRGMTGLERAEFVDIQGKLGDRVGGDHIRAVYPYLVKKLVFDDETNQPVFNDDDDDLVLTLAGETLELIAKTALELSGLGVKSEASEGNAS